MQRPSGSFAAVSIRQSRKSAAHYKGDTAPAAGRLTHDWDITPSKACVSHTLQLHDHVYFIYEVVCVWMIFGSDSSNISLWSNRVVCVWSAVERGNILINFQIGFGRFTSPTYRTSPFLFRDTIVLQPVYNICMNNCITIYVKYM